MGFASATRLNSRSKGRSGAAHRELRVLHVLAPSDVKTQYVNQMIESAPSGVTALTFTWPLALFGAYDVIHLHWPEFLLRHQRPSVRLVKRLLVLLLLFRLWLTNTPIVRTAHNLAPHEAGGSLEGALLRIVDRRTRLWIKLNPTTALPAAAKSVVILHGHYRGRYPETKTVAVPGRVLQFGLIRPYKGVGRLLDAFAQVSAPDASLHIVGRPSTDQLRDAVRAQAGRDPRVTCILEFVPDDLLAHEVRSAELVVLPYNELHNSGVALVALSLSRPILVPRTASSESLALEVGDDWVRTFDGRLTATDLEKALSAASELRARGIHPELRDRDWDHVGRAHEAAYRSLLN